MQIVAMVVEMVDARSSRDREAQAGGCLLYQRQAVAAGTAPRGGSRHVIGGAVPGGMGASAAKLYFQVADHCRQPPTKAARRCCGGWPI